MAGRHPQVGPCQPLKAQTGQKQSRAPVAPRAPPAKEEDPRVKCKDCGAFGHKARSIRCPMKHWDGAIAPQPLGSHKMKENRKLCLPHESGDPETAARPAGEEEQGPSQEDQQRQALLQRFPRRPLVRLRPSWKDRAESCDYVRHSHQPMAVHTTKRTWVGDTGLTSWSPVREPVETSTVSPILRAESSTIPPQMLSEGQGVPVSDSHHPDGIGFVQGPGSQLHSPGPALIPQAQAKHMDTTSPCVGQAAAHSFGQDSKVNLKAPGKRAAQSHAETCENPQKKLRLSPCPPPQKIMPRADLGCVQPVLPPGSAPELRPALAPQASRQTPTHGESVDLQPPPKGPVLSPVYTCLVPQPPLAPEGPRKPLRMVLRRLKRGHWSCRLLTTPSVLPAEDPAPPAQTPPSPGMSEGPCAPIPWTALYEDLQAFSSSGDSDGQ